jgi:hypothetical protein
MIYLGILIGLILGLPIGFIKWKKPVVVEKYSRRGLLVKEYTSTDSISGRTSKIECVFEVGELESTDTLSKIEVINLKPNRSEYNTEYERKRLTGMVINLGNHQKVYIGSQPLLMLEIKKLMKF